MTDQQPEQPTREELARRRRAAELLGDLEPQVTRDETGEGWNEPGWNDRSGTSRDQEILRDVPPHHGS